MNGVQLYIEMIDVDEDEDELIDIFIVDLILQANTSSDQPNRRGVNNIASMSLQFEAQCLPGFIGDFCMADITETTAGDDGSLSRNGIIGIGAFVFVLILMGIFVSIMIVLGYIVAKQRKEKKKLQLVTVSNTEEPDYAALVRALLVTSFVHAGLQDRLATHQNNVISNTSYVPDSSLAPEKGLVLVIFVTVVHEFI